MHIDIRIPYEPDKDLALAYNKAAANSSSEWLLFLDYDVMILNYKFYDILLSAISQVPPNCGWITARTNRLGPLTRLHQLIQDAPESDDLDEHTKFSYSLYDNFADDVCDITSLAKRVPLSGFFILTPTEVARKIGFRGPILGCDNNYCNDLLLQGHTIYMIPGLYVYHRRKREWMIEK